MSGNIPNPSLEITAIIGCSNKCSYCPQDILVKNYKDKIKKLSFDNYIKILSNVPKNVEICFAGFSEPFLNKDCSKMIKYTLDEGYKVILYTTLNGFNDNDIEILSGEKKINAAFHRYDGVGYNEEEFNKKVDIFCDKILQIPRLQNYDGRVRDVWSRGGNLYDEPNRIGKLWCKSTGKYDTFDRNVVLPNGDVSLCCMDYGLKHMVGNLLDTHFDNLDRSEIVKLCNENNSDIICRKCVISGKK